MIRSYHTRLAAFAGLILCALACGNLEAESRKILSLDGLWDIAESSQEQRPSRYGHSITVPGLVDMAQPPFESVGTNSPLRQAFWYRKRFRLDDRVPEAAFIQVHKAAFGAAVWMNGDEVGEHLSSFTPGMFNVRKQLRGKGEYNELVIRVGATREAVPPSVPSGWDFEKTRYLPGIFDSVELILSGTPLVRRIQAVPDIQRRMVRAQIWVSSESPENHVRVSCRVREAKSKRVVDSKSTERFALESGEERSVTVEIPMKDCRLWSPEDPFLYELEADTSQDEHRIRFGMREFRMDPSSGRAYLNGRPYYLRGSNVTLYRFFEDGRRGDLPWKTDWVRRLHREFKGMNWNALRYCIGFPPDFWYDIADEEGFLIQDEYPLWHLFDWPKAVTSDGLIRDYADWMQQRWNHPSVVIWDAQNESVTEETGKAIQTVRWLDLSGRPWDNGWSTAQDPGDVYESHPYLFNNPDFQLADLAYTSITPRDNPTPNHGTNAIIINEYGWLWLNRDGTPTTLTREVYRNLLGANSTPTRRRELYARYTAALTEFWRCHRQAAGVLHFVGLGYSRPDGQTCDPWLDVEKLAWEPFFREYVGDAFAPTSLMLDEWADDLPAGIPRQTRVIAINDLYDSWNGEMRFRLLRNKVIIQEEISSCIIPALGERRVIFNYAVPSEPGHYVMEASLLKPGMRPVSSLRDFDVLTDAQRKQRYGVAVDRPVTASSVMADSNGTRQAGMAIDGRRDTQWTSDETGAQWLAVDLEQPAPIKQAIIVWDEAYAKSYGIEVSGDGQSWREIFHTNTGNGNTDRIQFPVVESRWVRLRCLQPAVGNAYSVREFQVFP